MSQIDIPSIKKISASEVAQHISRDDLYIVIHKMVYNISSFINEHPGGEEVLFDVAGQDATDAFEDVGHSDEARDILKKLLVGELEGIIKMEQPSSSENSNLSKDQFNMKLYIITIIIILIAFLVYKFVF